MEFLANHTLVFHLSLEHTLSKFCRLGHSENGETPKEGLYMKKKVFQPEVFSQKSVNGSLCSPLSTLKKNAKLMRSSGATVS